MLLTHTRIVTGLTQYTSMDYLDWDYKDGIAYFVCLPTRNKIVVSRDPSIVKLSLEVVQQIVTREIGEAIRAGL